MHRKKLALSLLTAAAFWAASTGSTQAQWSGFNPVWTNSLVGIGTSTPADRLHISPSPEAAGEPVARWSTSDPNRAGQIGIQTLTMAPRYLTSMPVTQGDFIITAGTTAPPVGANDLILTNRTGGGRIRLGTSQAPGTDIEHMTVTSQGRVGIGSSTPFGKLDINTGTWNYNLPKISFNSSGNTPSLRFYATSGVLNMPTTGEHDAEAYPWYINVSGLADVTTMDFLVGPRTWIGSESVAPRFKFIYTRATDRVCESIDNTFPDLTASLHVGNSPTNGIIRFGSVEGIRDAGNNHIILGNGHVTSSDDNTYTLGNSTLRWSTVFAANGTINTSDMRQKDNIKDISYGLDEVMQLHPVSFTWKDKPEQGTKLGVIAQELQKVLPETVYDPAQHVAYDEEGNRIAANPDAPLGVYYSDLIPVLVKAIQEQQAVIEQKSSDIAELRARVAELEAGSGSRPALEQKARPYENILLEQNTPNPFGEHTTIMYFVPAEITGKVELVVADASGTQILQRFAVRSNTPDKVTVSARDLQPGVYLYGIAVNGSIVASKKMMVLK